MHNVKLLASDMDHTLLTEAGQLPPNFGHYLDALAEKHIKFVVASGRPLYTLQDIFPKHQNQMALICDNGAVIANKGQVIAKTLLPTSALLEICAFVADHLAGHPLLCGLYGAVAGQADQVYDTVYREFYHRLDYLPDLQQWTGEADKLTIYFPAGDAEQAFQTVLQPRYGNRYSVAVSGPNWVDIMPQHINKGQAMARISHLFHIDATEMMAFGDTFNDAEMLQYVKYGYLVANANPGMAPYAHYHTASNDDYGVVQVIKQVLAAQ